MITKIISAVGLTSCNPNWIPAVQVALGKDPDGPRMRETWSYPSVVGMLLYLSGNTQPDITFAVSQVACFTHAPKQSHAIALKTIIRYLSNTSDKGIIIRPRQNLELQCYIDADFGGLFQRDPSSEPSSTKSGTGYIIMLANCPVI